MQFVLLVEYIVVYSLVALWTAFGLLRLLYMFVKSPRTFFHAKERTLPPPVLQNGWNHAIVSLSEVKLHYVHLGENGKPLMLFLHGFPEFWYSWRHQLRHFQNDYKVVAVDLRGYGGSDKPETLSAYALPKLVQDVKELVAALGYKSCILVAHDWGGAVAWRCAMKYPEIVDRLIVLNCPNPVIFMSFAVQHPKQLLRSWYMFFFQSPWLPELLFRSNDLKALEQMFTVPPAGCTNSNAFTEEDIEAYKFVFSQPGAFTAPINYYRTMFMNLDKKRSENLLPAGKPIAVPTLVVWGTEDLALERGLAEKSIALCEKATVKYVDGASHWVQQDQPEKVNELMQNWLSSHI